MNKINFYVKIEGKTKTIFFDLDETLVHTDPLKKNDHPDIIVKVIDNDLE